MQINQQLRKFYSSLLDYEISRTLGETDIPIILGVFLLTQGNTHSHRNT